MTNAETMKALKSLNKQLARDEAYVDKYVEVIQESMERLATAQAAADKTAFSIKSLNGNLERNAKRAAEVMKAATKINQM